MLVQLLVQLHNTKMNKMNKIGQGHVEVIISFLLFIGAIFFIFFYINPFSMAKESIRDIEQVQKIIMQSISTEAGRLSITSFDATGCYDFSSDEYPGNYIEYKESTSGKYTIYFSDRFSSSNAPNKQAACPPDSYRLGVYSNDTIIIYDLLKNLVSSSTNDLDYKNFKKNLGINWDFSINCSDIDGNSIPELSFYRRIPSSIRVESKEFPIRILKSDGTIIQAIFNLKAW